MHRGVGTDNTLMECGLMTHGALVETVCFAWVAGLLRLDRRWLGSPLRVSQGFSKNENTC